MRGMFGNTEYFLVQMKASELVSKLTIPKDLDEWEGQSIEERFQRVINYKRVKDHIAPYLAKDPERFFGAFIVDMYGAEGVSYESLESVVPRALPVAYSGSGSSIGFLTFPGGEVLVPLDGQHRLAALKFAISGRDEKDNDIPGISATFDVGNDDCTVILVKHDDQKARKIFNKINRYAKPTSKTDNLITADDDIIAVISRRVVDNVINSRIVSHSNTLSAKSIEFTTLGTVYESTKEWLEELNGKIDDKILPPENEQDLYMEQAIDFWSEIFEKLTHFKLAIINPDEAGDAKRKEIREFIVLGKPIVQYALILAIIRMQMPDFSDSSRLDLDEIIDRINSLDWNKDNPLWQRVLMNGEKVIAGKPAAKFASRFISYHLGETLDPVLLDNLQEVYSSNFDTHKQLPDPKY
jgi:DNA sulfur modification protein DndB